MKKRPSQTARIAPRSTNAETPTDKPQAKQAAPKKAAKPLDQYDEVMTIEDVAEYLKVSVRTVYRMIDADEIGGIKRVGKKWRVWRDAFKAWLENEK